MSQSPEAMKVWGEAVAAADENGPALYLNSAAASVIEVALQKARDEERAAVVAWIEQDNISLGFRELAREIRRGEHRRER